MHETFSDFSSVDCRVTVHLWEYLVVKSRYCGVIVPIISPLQRNGKIDLAALGRLIDHLLSHRVEGVFVGGTTGEGASLSVSEKGEMVSEIARLGSSRVTIYAGVSSCCIDDTIESARRYRDFGADCVVAHLPFYFPALLDRSVEQFFRRVANAICDDLPLVLYNFTAMAKTCISGEVVHKLAEHENIRAIKDSDSDAGRLDELLGTNRLKIPVLLGSQSLYPIGLRKGAAGLVPSGANLVPGLFHSMYEAAARRDWNSVDEIHKEASVVCKSYLLDENGTKVSVSESICRLKQLLAARGVSGNSVKPPLIAHEGSVSPRKPRQIHIRRSRSSPDPNSFVKGGMQMKAFKVNGR